MIESKMLTATEIECREAWRGPYVP
jgi:hypothetical protein